MDYTKFHNDSHLINNHNGFGYNNTKNVLFINLLNTANSVYTPIHTDAVGNVDNIFESLVSRFAFVSTFPKS